MTNTIRLALAQIDTTVGDLQGNADKIRDRIRWATASAADIILFPELTITGYPPEDLLLKRRFVSENQAILQRVAHEADNIISIIGFVDKENKQDSIHNAAAILSGGRIAAKYHKICLPNYSVFDEKRYFTPGRHPTIFEYNGIKFGLNICEDIWEPSCIAESQAFVGGAEIILSISASPYYVDKRQERLAVAMKHARHTRTVLAYLNLVGGQDELVFDGNSLVIDHHGQLIAEGKQFQEDSLLLDIDLTGQREFRKTDPEFKLNRTNFKSPYDIHFVTLGEQPSGSKKTTLPVSNYSPLTTAEEIYQALVLGTRDYVQKNGFEKVVIGLSGGIDSALTATIAAAALGKENVIGILMPSEYTARESIDDAETLAENLGIEHQIIAIKQAFSAYEQTLQPVFADTESDITEENLQARIRGNLLMALSNKFGWLVLTTGNKSETSVGYCTLYGDMAGGFAVIKDLLKTWVYKLSEHINASAGKDIIPESILTKAPTAELKPDQTDQDTLPPYDLLDRILEEFVEKDKTIQEIIELGYDKDIVRKVARLVDKSEYKRRQAPPGIKITKKAFGKDRRVPITNKYVP
jgi:NAD+ synthase (glutamine-hydrolysing)